MTKILQGDFVYRTTPIVVERALGARLYGNGREYIDCQASSGAAVLGYDAGILSRIDLGRGPISKPQTCESVRRLDLAERIEELIFRQSGRRGRIGFELGGAQAIELALKIALCSRNQISLLTLEGAYHGRSLFTAHLSSSRRYTLGSTPSVSHFRLPNPYFVAEREKVDIAEATERCIRFVEEAFADERYGISDRGRTSPVFVFETVQNVAGMLDLPKAYLLTIERAVRERNGVCIADEIFSGVYRFGQFFTFPEKRLTPDIAVFSKGLTNGMAPLSALWVSEESELASTFPPGTHSCTYINNELAFALAHCVLDDLEKLDKKAIAQLGATLFAKIQKYITTGRPLSAIAKGSVLALNLSSREELARLSAEIVNGGTVGVLHASTGLAPRSMIFHPPYTISEIDLEDAAALIGTVLGKSHA